MYQLAVTAGGKIFLIKSISKDVNALYLYREDKTMIKNEVIGRIHLFSLEIFYLIKEYSPENTCKH